MARDWSNIRIQSSSKNILTYLTVTNLSDTLHSACEIIWMLPTVNEPWPLWLFGVVTGICACIGLLLSAEISYQGPGASIIKSNYTDFLIFLSKVCCCCFSLYVQLFATPWTVTCQPPLSMELPRQEYWSKVTSQLFPRGKTRLNVLESLKGEKQDIYNCCQIKWGWHNPKYWKRKSSLYSDGLRSIEFATQMNSPGNPKQHPLGVQGSQSSNHWMYTQRKGHDLPQKYNLCL